MCDSGMLVPCFRLSVRAKSSSTDGLLVSPRKKFRTRDRLGFRNF